MTRPRPSLLDAADDVRRRLSAAPVALVGLDFDGTLTEIVDDPTAPGLSPERREILARIPSDRRRLAIVSGRALADVRERVGLDHAIYVGNHGLEIDGPDVSERPPEAGRVAADLEALLDELAAAGVEGIEPKGLTATVHVRPRDDDARHAAVGAAIRPAAERAGFGVRPGKASWEIRPAGGATKGDALRRLLARLPGARSEAALYIGDDATDEDAFRALANGVTARVGPAGAPSAAGYALADPGEVYAFLARLLASPAGRGGSG